MRTLILELTQAHDNKDINTLLRRELHLSAADVRRAKGLTGGICLDGVEVYTTARVRAGQTLTVRVVDQEGSETIEAVPGPLDIRYEDEDIVIVDKAGGVPVHPSQGHHGDTLANFLLAHYRGQGLTAGFHPVNRLDRGTSGLMAVAKHSYAHQRLQVQLKEGTLQRRYWAVCQGTPPRDEDWIDRPIRRVPGSVLMREVHPEGAPARTHYKVLEEGNGRCLLALALETGRTHQIRVHLAALGCPLVGDFLYGEEVPELPERFALHSAFIRLEQPVRGTEIVLNAPLPPALGALLGR